MLSHHFDPPSIVLLQEMGSRVKGALPPGDQPAGVSASVAVPHVCVVVTLPSLPGGGAPHCHSFTHLAVDVISWAGAKRRHEAARDGRAAGGSPRVPGGRPLVLLRSGRAAAPAGLEWTADVTATSVKVTCSLSRNPLPSAGQAEACSSTCVRCCCLHPAISSPGSSISVRTLQWQ